MIVTQKEVSNNSEISKEVKVYWIMIFFKNGNSSPYKFTSREDWDKFISQSGINIIKWKTLKDQN